MVVGTRPEAIKMAPVATALRASGRVETRVALTGQHTSLVDQVLEAFQLDPEHELGIMREGQTLYDVAEGCLAGLRGVIQEFRPRIVLAQGDTASVFFASLVAFFERAMVGHVEAGLRSGDKWAPYPEEIFRRLSDVLSDFYFAPTPSARDNLLREGVDPDRIHVTGNTVVDALLQVSATERPPENDVLRSVLADDSSRLVLLTAHRRESFGGPLRDVFGAVRRIVDAHEDVQVVYPVHPNPNVVDPAHEMLGDHPRVHLVDPLPYLDLVTALKGAHLVLTDSGGIQEEAPTFGTPVLVLREVTERPEGVEAGVAILVGTDAERIVAEASRVLAGTRSQGVPDRPNPYGDGRAGERIADIVISALTDGPRSTADWDGL